MCGLTHAGVWADAFRADAFGCLGWCLQGRCFRVSGSVFPDTRAEAGLRAGGREAGRGLVGRYVGTGQCGMDRKGERMTGARTGSGTRGVGRHGMKPAGRRTEAGAQAVGAQAAYGSGRCRGFALLLAAAGLSGLHAVPAAAADGVRGEALPIPPSRLQMAQVDLPQFGTREYDFGYQDIGPGAQTPAAQSGASPAARYDGIEPEAPMSDETLDGASPAGVGFGVGRSAVAPREVLSGEAVAQARGEAPAGQSGGFACRAPVAQQWGLKIDNDLASGGDHGYSSGVMLDWAARMPAHDGFGENPSDTGWMCGFWRLLGGGQLPSESVGFRLDQAIYTPENSRATWLIPDDRPYAATLMATFSGTTLSGTQWVRNELRLGWVGPSIRGEQLQNAVHRVIDAPRFRGWAHQLHDEPLLELAQYRTQRWQPAGRSTDLLGHWGVRLGTLQTSAFAGLEWRFGSNLRDDGGSAPLKPGSNEVAETSWNPLGQTRWTWFLTAGARAVAWDLSLDGNVFHDSHSVKRRGLVFDGGAGVSFQSGPWDTRFMWVLRSREFDGQRQLPSYGSLLIRYAF